MPDTVRASGRRDVLPQLAGRMFLTDSGLETDLIFHHGFELPSFAAFTLLDDPAGRIALARYYSEHAAVAAGHGAGFVYETPTWRANTDWGARLGYGPGSLREVNQRAVQFIRDLMPGVGTDRRDGAVLGGCVGPRAEGYRLLDEMPVAEAREYHRLQVEVFAAAGVDLVNAMTISYPAEAIGIVQSAADANLPVAVSFTLETDGRLPDGTSLADAVRATDAATDSAAAYFMVNCAHPDHIAPAFAEPGDWIERVRGVRANASRRSHAQLDVASDLDDGDPVEFAAGLLALLAQVPGLSVLGGCCGSDVRHVAALAAAYLPVQR